MPSASESGFDAIELQKFSAAGRTIAAAVGTSVNIWARAEAGVILKTWAGRTKVRTEKALGRSGLLMANRQARSAAGFQRARGHVDPGQASVNLGIRGKFGRVWYRTETPGKPKFILAYGDGFIPTPRKIPGAAWPAVQQLAHRFQSIYQPIVAAAKKSAGLSRQSIVQIADDLGIRLEAVKGGGNLSAAGLAKARAALASNGQHYRNGRGEIADSSKSFYLTLINRYPKLGPLFMDKTLQWVITGRLKYFERNLEEGVFLSAKSAAKAYPYVEVLKAGA
jgi:hypothetical protein